MNKEELRELRNNLNKSQREMGELLGYTREHYCHLENGTYPITKKLTLLLKLLLKKQLS